MVTTSYFTTSGTWTCPLLVTSVIVTGCGGGGGGNGADTQGNYNFGAQGGFGAFQQNAIITVVPLATYTVTIGAGGMGGAPGDVAHGVGVGGVGGTTSLSNGSTILFSTIGGNTPLTINLTAASPGGSGTDAMGFANMLNTYSGGMPGTGNSTTGTNYAGSGGGAGPQGAGGNGGNGDSGNGSTIATNGANAPANSGGGGGGAGYSATSTPSCKGGNGGSGYLYISY